MITAYYIKDDMLVNSDGELAIDNYCEFILKGKGIQVFYHLDYTVARLMKLLRVPKETLHELLNTKFEVGVRHGIYTFKYIQGKVFSIERGKSFVNISDIYQYTDGIELLDTDDPYEKAKEAKRIGEEVYSALVSLGLKPTNLISPLNVYTKQVLSEKIVLQNESLYPPPVGKYAYACKHGAWVEAFQLGHFAETWDFDIKSCYAYFTSQLINPKYGTWSRSKTYDAKAYYGYGLAYVDIDSDFSPIVVDGVENDFTPLVNGELYLTKKEVDFIKEHNLGEVEIKDFVWFHPTKIEYPFKSIIEDLYERKEKSTGIQREVIKRCSSTIWGKLLQFKNDEFGEMFNSVLGIDVESSSRLEVARFVLDALSKGAELLHIAVDGVLLGGVPPATVQSGAMGSWALTSHSPAFVVGSGCVAIKDAQKDNPFSLRYDWLMDEINKNPESRTYTMIKTMPMTLTKALQKDKDGNDNFNKLGELIKSERVLEVDFETKREYPDMPTCGRDLLEHTYQSIPRDLAQVRGMNELS